MRKIKIYLFLTVAFVLLPVPYFSNASENVLDTEPGQLSYVFRLYYDNGQLFADRDFEFKYDIIPEEFVAEQLTTQFPFSGEVVSLKGETAVTFKFDPRRGEPKFLKGKLSVKAPYVPDGQKVVFYDSQGRQLLTIFVNDSSFCNDDAVCNFERGEDEKTCPNDCAEIVPPSPIQNLETDEEGNGFNPILLSSLIGALLAVGGWYGWRRWKKAKYVQENQFTNKLG